MNYFQKEMVRLFGSDVIRYECERRNLHQLAPTIEPAKIYGEITASQLCDILPVTYVLNGQTYYCRRYARDTTYHVTSLSEIRRFLKWDLTNRRQYIAEYDDCDDYQIILLSELKKWTRGLSVGHCDTPGHAKNIGVAYDDSNKMVAFTLEPQSDAITIPVDPVITMWWV